MRSKRIEANKSVRGFSVMEMLIVVAILITLAAMALPNLLSAIRVQKLRGAGNDFVGLLQQARMRAVQDDRFYSVYTKTVNGAQIEFVDIYPQKVNGASGTGGTTINAPDPEIQLTNEVVQQSQSAAPNTANLKSLFLGANPASVVPLDGTSSSSPITFGPEGLPCKPSPSGGATVCNTGGGPQAYWLFFQDQTSQAWEAVTVTPAGRMQKWTYTGTGWATL